MRNVILTVILLTALVSCKNNQRNGSSLDSTTVSLPEGGKYNFGTINDGQVIEINYSFKNTGENPLIITTVQPGCGCTIADKPKEPIAPGQTGVIRAKFDSKDRGSVEGSAITKTIIITSNATNWPNNNLLEFSGIVKKSK